MTRVGRVAYLRAFSRVIPSHSMFHRMLLEIPDTFSSFCSTPPQTTPDSLLLTGIRGALAPLRQQGCCLAVWLNQLLSQVLSPSPASTSAVSTRRSTTLRGETASTSRMTLPPKSQPPRTPTVFSSKRQPAIARSKNHQVW